MKIVKRELTTMLMTILMAIMVVGIVGAASGNDASIPPGEVPSADPIDEVGDSDVGICVVGAGGLCNGGGEPDPDNGASIYPDPDPDPDQHCLIPEGCDGQDIDREELCLIPEGCDGQDIEYLQDNVEYGYEIVDYSNVICIEYEGCYSHDDEYDENNVLLIESEQESEQYSSN